MNTDHIDFEGLVKKETNFEVPESFRDVINEHIKEATEQALFDILSQSAFGLDKTKDYLSVVCYLMGFTKNKIVCFDFLEEIELEHYEDDEEKIRRIQDYLEKIENTKKLLEDKITEINENND